MRKTITPKQRFVVYSKADFTCLNCGFVNAQSYGLAVDHIMPVFEGGGNNLENYQCLCEPCNRIKGAVIVKIKPFTQQLANLPFSVATNVMNDCRDSLKIQCGRKASGWDRRKEKTLEAIKKAWSILGLHYNTKAILIVAIVKTFKLVKQLLDIKEYLARYEQLVRAATPTSCDCHLAYK